MNTVPPNAKDKTDSELAMWLEGLSSGDQIYHLDYPNFHEAAQRLLTGSQRLCELDANTERNRKLFGRCLEVISTLEGECSTEEELLSALKVDIKTSMGVAPLIQNGLI